MGTMMGALHIKDKIHLMIGKLLRDSDWTTSFFMRRSSHPVTQSALSEHIVKRTSYAHQVSFMSLYLLKRSAYSEYCENAIGPPESFDM